MGNERRRQLIGGSAPIGEYDQDVEYMLYWPSRPVEERFAELERLRQQYEGREQTHSPREIRSKLTGGTRPLR